MSSENNFNLKFRTAIGFDNATAFSCVSLMKNGKFGPVKFPCGSSVVPSAILIKPDGEVVVGQDAELQAWKYPERFYSLFKPLMLNAPDKPIGNGPTPVELTSHLIRFLVTQLLVKYPELSQYPQFGGNGRDASELEICFGVPAGWGIEPVF